MRKVIVGLGNPGVKYRYSRHNLGFIIADALVADLGMKWKTSEKFDAKYSLNGDYAFLKPQTFMNHSGTSVVKFLKYYDVTPDNLIVINDDLDLPFLKTKKQFAAGTAGHNGVEDIVEKLGTKDFWRIRVGIGRPENKGIDASDWVLANFSKTELDALQQAVSEIKALI